MRLAVLVVLPLALLLRGTVAQSPDPVPPGYSGTFPSEAAQNALRDFASKPGEDKDKRIGGGTWQMQAGAVTPHALGPCRGDVMDMREATVKGPHLRLWREHLGVCFPATTDGDVAATLRWLGQKVPAGITGEPTPAWRRAAARLESLGAETNGVRIGLVVETGPPRMELVVWKTGTDKAIVTGKAALKIDGDPVAIELVWPVKEKPAAGSVALALAPGGTFVLAANVDDLLKSKHAPKLKEGVRLLQVEVTFRGAGDKDPALSTPVLQLMVDGPNHVK